MIKIYISVSLALACVFGSLLLTSCSAYEEVKENLKFLYPDYVKCNVAQVIDGDTFDCQLSDVNIREGQVNWYRNIRIYWRHCNELFQVLS
jgi:endonuclease YncB( thermonuclease family)